MRTVLACIFKYWKPILFSLLCLTGEAVGDLLQPTIMAYIVDKGIARKDMHTVFSLTGLMFLITAFGALMAVGRNIISSITALRFGADLRSSLFRKIQTFTFASIDRFETGSLVTRLTNDVNQVQQFVQGLMRIFVKAPIMAVGSVVMTVILNARMALVFLVAIPLIAIVIFINLKLGYPLFMKVQAALDKLNAVTQEYLSGVRVVKAFNRFDYERRRFSGRNDDLALMTTRAMRTMAFFGPGVGLILNLGIIAVLWFGGLRINQGGMHVGEIIAFVNYMSQMLFSLIMISMVITTFARARASADRIGEVLENKDALSTAASISPVPGIQTAVVFDNVTFSYGGDSNTVPALSNIHFSVKAGETIGIIGSTGAGKTSLMYLLPRFYDVTSGRVVMNDIDVREMDIASLRDKIGIVPQKTILFTGTIFDNIRWGRESATKEEVEKAAHIAQAHDFITLFPERYGTMLGQGGVNLSGGQKQRISIARALVRNPSILILDDCTSSVDVITEGKIRDGLARYMKDLTCFIITQRITSAMRADRILVLENGVMAGLGTHNELMAKCGVYRDIFRSQIGSGEELNA